MIAAATLAAACAALPSGAQAPRAPAAKSRPLDLDRAEFERGLRQSVGGDIIVAVERNYPEEGRRLIDRMFEAARATNGSETELAMTGARRGAELLRSKVPDAVNSPAAGLLRFNDAQLALFRFLSQRHPHLCGPAFFGQLTDPRLIPEDMMPFTRQISIAMLDAGGAGRRGGPIAGRGQMNPEHGAAWMRQMQALDSDGQVVPLFSSPATIAAAAPALQCRLAITTHDSLRRLPPETGAAMIAFFLAESHRQQAAAAAPAR